VLIADRSRSARVLLRSLLSEDGRFEVVADVSSSFAALSHCDEVDLVILDVVLGDTDGFAALGAIRSRLPELPVVFFSSVDPPYLRAEAERLGAAGFFTPAGDVTATIDDLAATVWPSPGR
jgi:DNA-binding NarL/FixJ family response regulator